MRWQLDFEARTATLDDSKARPAAVMLFFAPRRGDTRSASRSQMSRGLRSAKSSDG